MEFSIFTHNLPLYPNILSLYDEYVLPRPQRKIFCKNPDKFSKQSSKSPEKSLKISSPEKSVKESNSPKYAPKHSVSPVKDSEVNRKRLPESPKKEGEVTKKKFKKITFP